jgi:NADPH-dependent glutamate synthase beta subunit-like oxidoreductase
MAAQEDIARQIRSCVKGRGPVCSDACPLHLDVRGFIGKLQKGNLSSALKILQKDLVFPALVSATCEGPCLRHCALAHNGDSLALPILERAVLSNAKAKSAARYRLPGKGKTVAVIGGGICGLFCAQALLLKQYSVLLYEAMPHLGGSHAEAFALPDVQTEIAGQFEGRDIQILLGEHVASLEDLQTDAVFIATGEGGEDFGLLSTWDASTYATRRPHVFMAGGVAGVHALDAARQGREAADQIDRFLMGGKPVPAEERHLCGYIPRIEGIPSRRLISEASLTPESAAAEARRCLKCDCDECMQGCLMLRGYSISPPDFAREIVNDLKIVSHGTASRNATRKIASCNLCGLCSKLCPEGADIGEMVGLARNARVAQGSYPSAFHEFWLEQMTFSLRDASLVGLPDDIEHCSHVFFPGCQLGASDPEYVLRSFEFLQMTIPGKTGLMLSCCGAPADWAGQEERHGEVVSLLRRQWQSLGSPTVVFACATCARQWSKFLPEAECVSLYEMMAAHPDTYLSHRR